MNAMLFLGYDPGGRDANGLAAIKVSSKGVIKSVEDDGVVDDAPAALEWFSKYKKEAKAIGIDTLLAWSCFGRRECDKALKKQYREYQGSVKHQNSLRGAMTINGAIVARKVKLPCLESHPKLFLKIATRIAKQRESERKAIESVLKFHENYKNESDDVADAIVAAWCAAMGYSNCCCKRKWEYNLYDLDMKGHHLVVKGARYPWPEKIGDSQ